ncbi:putative ring-cleavage extradiol dioxygenase [Halanaeroarchaeum sp. HSR-CO]|uniref:VOC family protein n=1 Tax=Halanaeroarchaeum sp. HSR-CO TaxID=2866382 RepID=UPI00217CC226|nr:VOC family protein [Halanaeroarchaeum sp. HSR-CO]UWG48093.1 putative ring-cleavage extradiol dioxygenase [Halanaeroarchaeum sp. HSR-CO]
MLDDLAWLSLEVLYAERASEFYAETFDLEPAYRDGSVVFPVGDHELRLVEPGPVPRGGLHVHFAMATPPAQYDGWVSRLERDHDIEEHSFGSSQSVYLFDPDGHCAEIGSVGDPAAEESLTGIFEVVFEVEDLERAETFYSELGFSVVDRGDSRRRVRMTGPVDLELWEPQRGLADARGGVHVDVGFTATDPVAVRDRVADLASETTRDDDWVRIRDPDGHFLTITPTG